MLKYLYWLLLFLVLPLHWTAAQSTLQRRLILIGDAGEMNVAQSHVMAHAREQVITDSTTVFFLGDNIYPDGYQEGTVELEQRSQHILKSQYAVFQDLRVPIYFIPGNHDWAHSGKEGLKAVRAQGRFLAQLADSLIRMLPSDGCPGPVEVNLSKDLVAIVLDSEWWVFPYQRNSPDQQCAIRSESELIAAVKKMVSNNQDKTVLLVAHHPLQTNGSHGGYFNWKDHLFPLTHLKSYLYVPLPGLGSLYPIGRRTFLRSPEDLVHEKYQQYRDQLYTVLDGFPNVIYVGGHEHGLQLLKDAADRLQVVSGSGAKTTYLKKKSNALFLYEKQGYVVMDYMSDRSVVLRYFAEQDGQVINAFEYEVPYRIHKAIYPEQVKH